MDYAAQLCFSYIYLYAALISSICIDFQLHFYIHIMNVHFYMCIYTIIYIYYEYCLFRIETYLQSTRPIIKQYEQQGKVHTVDASRSVDEVRLFLVQLNWECRRNYSRYSI